MHQKIAALGLVALALASVASSCSGLGSQILNGVYLGDVNAVRTSATLDGQALPSQTFTQPLAVGFSAGQIAGIPILVLNVPVIDEALTTVGQSGTIPFTGDAGSQTTTWTVTELQYGDGQAHVVIEFQFTVNSQDGTSITGQGALTADFTASASGQPLQTTQTLWADTAQFDANNALLHQANEQFEYSGTMSWTASQ